MYILTSPGLNGQYEIWQYNTRSRYLTRLTHASAPDRISAIASINSDGSKITFSSDSDFLGQGIVDGQGEIWLFSFDYTYLPLVLKN